jgi:hypothetical protein
MLTENALLEAGFEEFKPHSIYRWTKGFQKCIKSNNSREKLFFINVHMWDFSKYEEYKNGQLGWDAETYLYQEEDSWIVLQLHGIQNKTPQDLIFPTGTITRKLVMLSRRNFFGSILGLALPASPVIAKIPEKKTEINKIEGEGFVISTNFNLEQTFDHGQPCSSCETIKKPDVEIEINIKPNTFLQIPEGAKLKIECPGATKTWTLPKTY